MKASVILVFLVIFGLLGYTYADTPLNNSSTLEQAQLPDGIKQAYVLQNGVKYPYEYVKNFFLSKGKDVEDIKNHPIYRQFWMEPSFLPLQSQTQTTLEPTNVSRESKTKSDSFSPAWRSLVLPGWGQYYNEEKTKGFLFGGITIGLFAAGWATYFMSESSANDYLALGANLPQSQYDEKYSNWENISSLNHTLDVCFGLAYAWTAIDAMLSSKPITYTEKQSNIKLSPNKIEIAFLKTTF